MSVFECVHVFVSVSICYFCNFLHLCFCASASVRVLLCVYVCVGVMPSLPSHMCVYTHEVEKTSACVKGYRGSAS